MKEAEPPVESSTLRPLRITKLPTQTTVSDAPARVPVAGDEKEAMRRHRILALQKHVEPGAAVPIAECKSSSGKAQRIMAEVAVTRPPPPGRFHLRKATLSAQLADEHDHGVLLNLCELLQTRLHRLVKMPQPAEVEAMEGDAILTPSWQPTTELKLIFRRFAVSSLYSTTEVGEEATIFTSDLDNFCTAAFGLSVETRTGDKFWRTLQTQWGKGFGDDNVLRLGDICAFFGHVDVVATEERRALRLLFATKWVEKMWSTWGKRRLSST
jgi:hypothetical protein